jgi:hypothetical protein
MKLYYTSSTSQDAIQADPRLSLGGYKSASPLPNNAFDNLFSEITQFMLSKLPEDEFIALVLKNETGVEVDNLWLWFEYGNTPYSKYLVAAVDMTADVNGILQMEHVPNRNSKPLYADFYEAPGQVNAVEIGTVAIDGMVGIWIQRSLVDGLADSIQAENNLYTTDPNNADLVVPIVPDKQDAISIHMEWGLQYYGSAIGEDIIV